MPTKSPVGKLYGLRRLIGQHIPLVTTVSLQGLGADSTRLYRLGLLVGHASRAEAQFAALCWVDRTHALGVLFGGKHLDVIGG